MIAASARDAVLATSTMFRPFTVVVVILDRQGRFVVDAAAGYEMPYAAHEAPTYTVCVRVYAVAVQP